MALKHAIWPPTLPWRRGSKPGSRIATGNADIFRRPGGFGVQNDDGQVAFTRRGDVRVNQNGELALVTGELVLDDGGGVIVPPVDQALSISDEGVSMPLIQSRK